MRGVGQRRVASEPVVRRGRRPSGGSRRGPPRQMRAAGLIPPFCVFITPILCWWESAVAKLKCGLIQMGLKGDVALGPEKIRDKMIEAHLPLIDKAGAAG